MWDDLKEFFEWGKGLLVILLLVCVVALVCTPAFFLFKRLIGEHHHRSTQYIRCGEQEWHDVSNIGIEGEAITFTKDGKAYAVRAAGVCEWGEMSVPVEKPP
jgi:hypothetical protein